MKVLIVGFGSIGQRHARLLRHHADEVRIVTSQTVSEYMYHPSLEDALASFAPDALVICKATAEHGTVLDALSRHNYRGKVLVEKPMLMHAREYTKPYGFPVKVAYQLRFHPMMLAVKNILRSDGAVSAHAYVGQHLGSWRPGREVKDTYSAHTLQGGGVMRDLSHEIDMAQYLLGGITQCIGIARRAGDVTVDSEDVAVFAMSCERCPAISMQLNYLDHVAKREWVINTRTESIRADLIANTLTVGNETKHIKCDRDMPYISMHEAWLSGNDDNLCSLDEGLSVVNIIDAVPYGHKL